MFMFIEGFLQIAVISPYPVVYFFNDVTITQDATRVLPTYEESLANDKQNLFDIPKIIPISF